MASVNYKNTNLWKRWCHVHAFNGLHCTYDVMPS